MKANQINIMRHINKRSLIAAIHDAIMAATSFVASLYIRLGEEQFYITESYLYQGTILFTIICISVFSFMRLYRGLWRFASMHDMVAIAKSATLSILIFAACMFIFNRLDNIPRSALLINWMVLMIMLAAPRFAYRSLKDRTLHWEMTLEEKAKIPVLLIGATGLGEQFIQDMMRDPRTSYHVIGILDQDVARKNCNIYRTRIYGTPDMLEVVVRKLERNNRRPHKILIADANISGETLQDILKMAEKLALPVARIPRLSEFKQHFDNKIDVQPIAVEDLLGRPQTPLDTQAMGEMIRGKRVLITGAGGSIGSELCRQIASFSPSSMLLLDNSEHNLYQIDRELSAHYAPIPILGDVRNTVQMDAVFANNKPQIVFHAAAVKHVPLSESNAEEAILTNIFGTKTVADACVKYSVSDMVMISTDKAVNPTNIMGATKKIAETYCQALGRNSHLTRFVTVRFGNVLGSTGSVVPLFREQIAAGGPVTVTHRDMTRYFMTIREAVALVLQAAVLGAGMADKREHIFVLDMGKPVKIVDLAEQMIRLAGRKPYEDIEIRFTGLRPGEKLHEELFHEAEKMAKTSHDSIFQAAPRAYDLGELQTRLHGLKQAAETRACDQAISLLKALVPEFKSLSQVA